VNELVSIVSKRHISTYGKSLFQCHSDVINN